MSTSRHRSVGLAARASRLLISCSVPASAGSFYLHVGGQSLVCIFQAVPPCQPRVSAPPGSAAGAVFGYVGIDGLRSK